MLLKRTLVSVILLPIGLGIIVMGGWIYTATIAAILFLAALEYVRLFKASGWMPSGFLTLLATLILTFQRAFFDFQSSDLSLSLIILTMLTYHLIQYERGRDQAATDFAVTLSGALYIGWIGAYMISLRSLPDGLWWVLVILPAIWLADSAAYLVGKRFGRRHLTYRLSPKKTWEGYLAGILASVPGTALLAWIYGEWVGAPPIITPGRAALLAFFISALAVLGDLGESMIKRQVGVKDSGNLLPGHGGMFDRIDSWLWAAVLGYYLITGLFL